MPITSNHQPFAQPLPALASASLRLPGAVRAFLLLRGGAMLAWAGTRWHAGGAASWLGAALLRPHVAALLAKPSGSLPGGGAGSAGGAGAGELASLLLAVACTLGIVALFLTPAWLPGWRRWRAMLRLRLRARSSDAKQAAQRFAEAVARGDFEVAEAEAEHLLHRRSTQA